MRVIDRLLMRDLLKRDELDEEVWRSTEEGKHFKIETETGEIRAGFGGKLNGQKIKSKEERKAEKERKPTRSEAAGKTLQKVINRIRNYKNEQNFIIGQDGTILHNAKGKQHMVSTTVGTKREFLKGNINLHNHPNGGTFSEADFRDFGYGATEAIVTGPDGTYCLKNLRVGKPDQYNGWYDMREKYVQEVPQDVSLYDLMKQADKNLAGNPTRKRIHELSEEGVKKLKSGVPNEEVRQWLIDNDWDGLNERAKKERKDEMRRLEVEPAHEWLKKNAGKFGFEYTFTPHKGA